MREHQITINLRPDQFQEVQRLSRAAGARSIGLFAREKLLLTLGLSGAAAGLARAESPDLASVTNDVRRLHRELQTFIGESLSGKDYAYDTMAAPAQIGSGASSQATEASTSPPDQDHPAGEQGATSSPVGDEMEDMAERAFAISPRLGSIEELSDEEVTYSDPLDELLGDIMALEETPELQGIILASGTESEDRSLSDSTEIEVVPGQDRGEDYEEFDQPEDEQFADEPSALDEPEEGNVDEVVDSVAINDERERVALEGTAAASADPENVGDGDGEQALADDTSSVVDDEDQSGPESADSPTDPPPPPTNFPNIPPISGGPPPRKRRT